MRLPARPPLALAGALLLSLLAAACATTGGGDDEPLAVERAPFACGQSARYALEDIDGMRVASGTLETRCEGDALVLVQRYDGEGGSADVSRATVDAASFRPASSSREARRGGAVERWEAEYAADLATVAFTRVEPDGDIEDRSLRLRDNAYENQSALWLWRALPLDEGYKADYVSVSAVSRSQITVRLSVAQQERVEVPAGIFETWRLQVRSGRATRVAWIGVDYPHPLVRWDNGEQIFLLEQSAALP